MPLENRNLEPGTVLAARHKGKDRTCEVVRTDDGLRYRLDDGTEHKSPSSAGKAVVGHACNGWVFWSLAGTERPARKPKAAPPDKPKETAKAASKAEGKKPAKASKSKGSKKPKAVRAAATGDSYGCGACPETFPTVKAATEHAITHTTGD